MRLRNIKNAQEIIEKSPYYVKNNLFFNNNKPIYIEIGMGKGDFIINNAKQYPDINFIGIEKYPSVLVKAVGKLENETLDNLKIIAFDAIKIDELFNKNIDLIYLNFSDPWPKERHHKRRLTSKEFLDKYEKICKKNSHIIMKTDNRGLFESSIKSFNNSGYKINDISLDLYKDNHEFNIQTEYETKFVAKGMNIYYIDAIKIDNN